MSWLLLTLAVLACVLLLRALLKSRRANEVADPIKQLGFVSEVEFVPRALVNKSEFKVLLLLEEAVRERGAGHRVMAQTCYGEFLKPKDRSAGSDTNLAYRSINSKRADFVIIDAAGFPVAVVEYQGHGHYRGTAAQRDAVKREALRSAGITLIEVMADYTPSALLSELRLQLARADTCPKSAVGK